MSFDLPTFIFQAVNFLVLVAVLWRLLWRPLRRHMTDRQERIVEGLTAVEEGKREVEETREEAATTLEIARKKEREVVAAAEREAEARRGELLETARTEAAAERDRLLAQVELEQERREREFLRTLTPSVARVLEALLRQLGDAARLHAVTCERFAEELRRLPDDERRRLREAAERSGEVELVCAAEDVPDALVSALEALFPATSVGRRIDTTLVGGAALHVGEMVVDGSVSAQVQVALEKAA